MQKRSSPTTKPASSRRRSPGTASRSSGASSRSGASRSGTSRRASSRSSSRKKAPSFGIKRYLPCLRIPAWGVWTGAILIAVAYVLFFYHFFVDPFSFRWKAIYHGDENVPAGYSVHGIDISRYQGIVDWEVLRNANIGSSPVRFVFIKGTEGVSIVDENFNLNFYHSRKNDFIRGVYHFYTPDVSGEKQARFFMKQVHLEPGDLPPVLDVEKAGDLSTAQLQREVKTWLSMVEKRYGVKPIIYSGYKFKEKYLNDSLLNTYPFWIAHYYVEKLSYKKPWHFWQFTDCGKVKGIEGYVDCNIFNGSEEELLNLTIPDELE